MPLTDLSLDLLREYRPEIADPPDFDSFWASTLEESRALSTAAHSEPAQTPIDQIEITDFTFSGFGGERVSAWISRPRDEVARPVVIEYQGYGGGRGLPGERLQWAAAGFVHVLMDTRGQGSGWGSGGSTADPHGSDPATPGYMTRGIGSPETYYYRRVFADAVLLVDEVKRLANVHASQVFVTGGSQGGGISLAVAALTDVAGVMPDVPFLCDFRRSVELTPSDPFVEIRRYLSVHRDAVENVFTTLSYFDGVNFARRATAPALFSVALMDDIVLPSTVFAAFNHYLGAARDIEVYPFNGHEGGQMHHWLRQVEWIRAVAGMGDTALR